jgi:hexulose-6-phosphate isomerase
MNQHLTRRDFVAATAAAGTLAAVAGVSLAAPRTQPVEPTPRPQRVRKALKVGMIAEGGTLTEKFQIAAEAGFEGVELDSPWRIEPGEVFKAKEATGLEVPGVVDAVHWSRPLSEPNDAVRAEGLKALEAAIRECQEFGGSSVLLVPAVVNKAVPYADAYRRSQDEIRKVLPLCRELNIQIAIENVWNNFLLSPLEAARYTDELESPLVGWHFDIGNIVNYGWPEHWIRTLAHRIFKLDVKDYSRKKRDEEGLWKGFGVDIGDGDSGWAEVRQALDDIRYTGWATAEVGGGDKARLIDIARRMDQVLNV